MKLLAFMRLLSVTSFLYLVSSGLAQTANISLDIPATGHESFAGEQVCFTASWTNTGNTGFGPYYQLILAPDLTFASASFLNSSVSTSNVGTFSGSALTDPWSQQSVPASNVPTDASSLTLLRLPAGSVVTNGPLLELEICATLATDATLNVAQDDAIRLIPVYEYGDSATGTTAIVGSETVADVTPSVIIYSYTDTSTEGEVPPGTSYPFNIVVTGDIASTKTVSPIQFPGEDGNYGIDIPEDVQFTASPITITGASSACTVTIKNSSNVTLQSGSAPLTPNATVLAAIGEARIIEASCLSDTGAGAGVSNDISLSIPVFITNTLDGAQCLTEDELNTAKHVGIAQSASPTTAVPGNTVTFTTSINVSDFVDVTDLSIQNILEDGFDYNDDATITVASGTYTLSRSVATSSGETTVTFNILGTGGTTTGVIATDFDASSTATITFTADVLQTYNDAQPIRASDSLNSTVTGTYNLSQGAASCTEGTSSTTSIQPISIEKTVVNPASSYDPGDSITYRLTMTIPSGDSQDIIFEDYFPLPIIDVDDGRATYAISSNPSLASNPNISLGPDHNAPFSNPESIVISGAQNKLTLNWPDLAVSPTSSVTIQVDIQAKVNDAAFNDGLILSNFLQASANNTQATSNNSVDAADVKVNAPNLVITKGVSTVTDGDGTTAKNVVNPVNTILPIDGNATNADADDKITYVITVENQGGAPAHNVSIRDIVPSELENCSVLTVQDGTGTTLTTGAVNDLFSTNTSDYTTWLNLSSTLSANDGTKGSAFSSDTAVVTFTCDIKSNTEVGTTITNNAEVTFTSTSDAGAEYFPVVTELATVTLGPPSITKVITVTSEAITSDATAGTASDPRHVVVGEIVRYRIETLLPEGVYTNLRIQDQLPTGLQFVDDGSAKIAFIRDTNMTTNNDDGKMTICGTFYATSLATTPSCSIDGTRSNGTTFITRVQGGNDPYFLISDVTNNDNDANNEYIVIEFNAVVLKSDSASNDHNDNRDNRARVFSAGNTVNVYQAIGERPRIKVVEPHIFVEKKVRIVGDSSYVDSVTVDANDEVEFRIRLTVDDEQNSIARTTAFETVIEDSLPDDLDYSTASLTALSSWNAHTCSQTGITGSVATGATDVVSFPAIDLLPGDRCEFTLRASSLTSVIIGETLSNTATATYSSLDESGTTGNATGTDSGSEEHSYTASDSVSINIDGAILSKSYVSTDKTHTDNGDAATAADNANAIPLSIGESVRYRLELQLPEASGDNFIVTDLLPDGLKYTGNLAIAFISNANQITSSQTINCSSGTLLVSGTAATGVTPDCVITDNGVLVNLTVAGASAGDDLAIDLGTVSNSNSDATQGEYIVIEFDAIAENVAFNQEDAQLDNSFTLDVTGVSTVTSNIVHAEIVEPQITLSMSASPNTAVTLGSTVSWTIELENTGSATAFDALWSGFSLPWDATNSAGLSSLTSLVVTNPNNVSDGTDTVDSSNFLITNSSDPETLTVQNAANGFIFPAGAKLTLTFDSSFADSFYTGALGTETFSGALSSITYKSQETAHTVSKRDSSNLSSGTGNTPNTDATLDSGSSVLLNDYRTEATPQVSIIRQDFGDAPAVYDTPSAAAHTNPSTISVYLGATAPDYDATSQQGSDSGFSATGDDGDANGDDEDGITDDPLVTDDFPILLEGATSYSLDVSCAGAGVVAAWIDFDIDDSFETSERNTNHPVTCASGTATLTWSG